MSSSTVKLTAIAILAVASAAGCSGSDQHQIHNAAAAVTDAPSAGTVHQAPIPTKIANQPSVRKNIVQTKCAAVPGGWGAEGTAINPGKKPVTYKIVIHFTTTKATVLDYAETAVPVDPGKTVKWQAKKQFKADTKMLCPMPGISVTS
jgi:uncharacterized cupredoxin-like copper-binding protein